MNTHRSALVLMFSLAALLASEWASADQALATSKACMACHTIDKKVVGPAFKDVARKYAGNKEAQSILANKILKGGSGVWGPLAMPPNAQLSEADARKLAGWVLQLK